MKQIFALLASLIAVAAILGGCGGGGGGGTSGGEVPTGVSLSGTILESNSRVPVVGARITVGTQTVVTNSDGRFNFNFTTRPTVSTYSIDLSAATPDCYTFWANANGIPQPASSISMPTTGSSLGTIYVISTENAPPPPFIKSR